MKPATRTILWTALFCLLLGGAARAADEGDAPPGATLPEVTVTARGLNESTEDPPAFVEVIPMDRFAGRLISTEEALRQAAGVNVRNFGGLGAYSTVSIRGSSSDQVVVLVDGVRLNEAAGGGVNLGAIPPDQIARIEVYRGGESALFGEGAIGGVVNIITRDGAGAPGAHAGASYGSFDTLRLTVSNTAGGEQWRAFAGGSLFHTDGDFPFRNDNGTTLDRRDDFWDVRENNAIDSRNLLLRGGWSPTAQFDMAAHNDLYSAQAGSPGLTTFPSPDAGVKLLRDLSSLSFALTGLGVSGLSAKATLSHRYEWSRFRDDRGEQTGVPILSTRAEYEPAAQQTVSYAWGTHQLWTLTGGWDGLRLRAPEFGDPSRDSGAGALSDQVQFFAERLVALAAVRYDYFSDFGGQWSPKAGLSGKPWEPLTLKGNVGRSFRAPNFTELYFNQGVVTGNPELKPETSMHCDAGLQAAWRPWFFFEGAWFRNDVEDLIEYELISGFRYKPFNVGQARLEGMELSLRAGWPPHIALSGAYTLTYAIDETDDPNRRGNQIPGRPRHVAFGRLEGRAGPVAPFVEFNYVGGNYVTAANTKLLPERKLWNAGLTISQDASVRLGLEVKNLTDEQVVDVRGFPLPGRAIYTTADCSF
jgi:iron complex outermembrane receptor protein